MKKFQIPVVGGIRKVLYVQPNAATGTTIEGLPGTVTLAQLASLITQLQAQQVNTGGGNIGEGTEATLTLGPGLSGGGILQGNVPIRLTSPVPWFDDGGGSDGDPGPPGQAGVAGINGPTGGVGPMGPAVFMAGEDGTDGWDAIPGPQGPQGVTGSQGPQGIQGSGSGGSSGLAIWLPEDIVTDEELFRGPPSGVGGFTVNGPLNVNGISTHSGLMFAGSNLILTAANPGIASTAGGAVLAINANTGINLQIGGSTLLGVTNNAGVIIEHGASGQPALQVIGTGTTNANFGVLIEAGTGTDYALKVVSSNAGSTFFEIFGNGAATIGTGIAVGQGQGTLNVQNGYYLNNVPLALGGANTTPAGVQHGMIVDDNQFDEPIMIGPQSALGELTVNGPLVVNAGTTTPLTVGSAAAPVTGAMTISYQNASTVSGDTVRHNLIAGSEALALYLSNQNQSAALITNGPAAPQALIRTLGAIPIVFGTNNTYAGQFDSSQNLQVVGYVATKGATPAVAAGTTAIGTTTTTTVITTAGGVAIPVLAATMWVVNVNGVQYGIPCFAL